MSLDNKDLDKIGKKIRDELFAMFSEFGGGKDDRSDDPEDYTRSCEILDGDALMKLSEMEHLRRRGERLMSEARGVFAQHHAAKTQLFHKLEDVYPKTVGFGPGHDYIRWAYWKGKYYLLSMDKEHANADPSDSRADSQGPDSPPPSEPEPGPDDDKNK